MSARYADKVETLRALFGTLDVTVAADRITVAGVSYPIIGDVIVLLEPHLWPTWIRQRSGAAGTADRAFAPDIQATFGAEWRAFPRVLPEHAQEFAQYFDIVDLQRVAGKRVMDLGCGIGRWSYFLKDRAREVVLVDFSEAIFVARQNLDQAPNALFFLADLTALPFRRDCADLVVCLGVLHHLPIDALDATRKLERYAPELLIYLYSALDARPAYQRALLHIVTGVRMLVSRVESPSFRNAFTWLAAATLYWPLIALGDLLRPFGLSNRVPLYEFYARKSAERVRQDVYDRFFTRIEQRVTRQQVLALRDTFARITVSEQIPQWHFMCERKQT